MLTPKGCGNRGMQSLCLSSRYFLANNCYRCVHAACARALCAHGRTGVVEAKPGIACLIGLQARAWQPTADRRGSVMRGTTAVCAGVGIGAGRAVGSETMHTLASTLPGAFCLVSFAAEARVQSDPPIQRAEPRVTKLLRRPARQTALGTRRCMLYVCYCCKLCARQVSRIGSFRSRRAHDWVAKRKDQAGPAGQPRL